MRGKPGRLFPAEMSRDCGGNPCAATGFGAGAGGGGSPQVADRTWVAVEEKKLGGRKCKSAASKGGKVQVHSHSLLEATPAATDPGPRAPCPEARKAAQGAGRAAPEVAQASRPPPPALLSPLAPHPARPRSRVGSAGSAGAAAPPAGDLAPARPRRRRRRAGGAGLAAGRDARTGAEHTNTPVLPFKITSLPPGRRPGRSAPPRKAALGLPAGVPAAPPPKRCAPLKNRRTWNSQAQSNC